MKYVTDIGTVLKNSFFLYQTKKGLYYFLSHYIFFIGKKMTTCFIIKGEDYTGRPKTAPSGEAAAKMKAEIEHELARDFYERQWGPLVEKIEYLRVEITQGIIEAVAAVVGGISYRETCNGKVRAAKLISEADVDRRGYISISDARRLMSNTRLWRLPSELTEDKSAKRRRRLESKRDSAWYFFPVDGEFSRSPAFNVVNSWSEDLIEALVLTPANAKVAWKLAGDKRLLIIDDTDAVDIKKWVAEEDGM